MRLSVIIKTLNEQANIERAIRSALDAVAAVGSGEVIVADSKSTDRTCEIAAQFPVRIVQLSHAEDRCCGVGAQLGYAVAQGEYLYILDGDMTFEPGFVEAAIAALEQDSGLAGVGGQVREMNLDNEEFVNRAQRRLAHFEPGPVDRLDMGGLYRRSALAQVGYFTNQNLHAYEEFELAARLASAGWRLCRLDHPGICHYGHTETSYRLLAKRWTSRYAWGCGELLRQSLGKPHLSFVLTRLHVYRLYFAVLAWCFAAATLVLLAAVNGTPLLALAGLGMLALPVLLMSLRRKSLARGLYAVSAWGVFSAGLLAGLLAKPRREPTDSVRCVSLK